MKWRPHTQAPQDNGTTFCERHSPFLIAHPDEGGVLFVREGFYRWTPEGTPKPERWNGVDLPDEWWWLPESDMVVNLQDEISKRLPLALQAAGYTANLEMADDACDICKHVRQRGVEPGYCTRHDVELPKPTSDAHCHDFHYFDE